MKHPHAELMAQYAQDAMETDKPWERWEFYACTGIWIANSSHPGWDDTREYRRKPKPYEPTLLDQALELEIEAVRLRRDHYISDYQTNSAERLFYILKEKLSQRSPAMIEHLKQQGKL